MVESVNLPCILSTLRAESPGVSKLVRILGCTADFGYLKGTLRVPLKYAKFGSTPNNSN